MEKNLESTIPQTAKLRSAFDRKRRFLSKFYKTDRHHAPSRTEVILSVILVLLGLLLLFFYSDLNVIYSVFMGCSVINLLFTLYRYLHWHKRG